MLHTTNVRFFAQNNAFTHTMYFFKIRWIGESGFGE